MPNPKQPDMEDNAQFLSLDEALTPELPPRPSYAQRIQRAHDLSERYKNSSELLLYYGRLALYQQCLFNTYQENGSEVSPGDASDPWPLFIESVLPQFQEFLGSLGDAAPALVRIRSLTLATLEPDEQEPLLRRFWDGELPNDPTSTADYFILLAFLQPYAEWLAQSGYHNTGMATHATCPVCASEPICAVLRDQHHGARKSLICSLCMHEWPFLRVACPACGEERFESLPVFTAEEYPHVRVDACLTCKHYLKTIDMTKDGLAVPIVDELAAVSLDLWAREQGYEKLVRNLAGL
jgi:FdhE protein